MTLKKSLCSNIPFTVLFAVRLLHILYVAKSKQIRILRSAIRGPRRQRNYPRLLSNNTVRMRDTDNVQIIMCCFFPYINFYMNFVLVCSKYIASFSKTYSMILYELRLVACLVLRNEASMRAFIIAIKFSLDNNFNSTKLQSKLVGCHFN